MMHREQGRGVAGRGQSRPGRRLILRLESEGRAKRSLEEKHGFMWNCNVCSEILEWIWTTKLDMNCNAFHFQRKKDILEFCEKLVHGEEEELLFLNRQLLWLLWESLKGKRFILLNRLLWSLWEIFKDKRFIKEACCRVYMGVLHFLIGQCSCVGKTIWLPCAAEPFPLDDGICVQYVYLNILKQSNDFH